jgi:transcriptional regulator GlxA family with amidase domain
MFIAIAVADGVFASGFSLIYDTLTVAEAIRPAIDPQLPEVRIAVAGEGPLVRAGSGVAIPTSCRIEDVGDADVVAVPGLGALDDASVLSALQTPGIRRLIAALQTVAASEMTIASACTGSFALAEAGLLDGRRATTSWWVRSLFERRYPAVELDVDRMLVRDDNAITAGAAFAHVDLALALVRLASVELADRVGQLLLIDQRASQSLYVAVDHISHADPLVADFERYVRANLAAPLRLEEISRSIGTTRRTLERRVAAVASMTPLELIRRIRAERASHLLSTTEQSVEQVALSVGYANASTVRELLRRYRQAA